MKCTVLNSRFSSDVYRIDVRPRGLAGALLVIKTAGALAEQGKTMREIVDVCQTVRGHLRTIGLSASGIRAPGHQQSFEVRARRCRENERDWSPVSLVIGRRDGTRYGHSR